jgi:hypothetical protein
MNAKLKGNVVTITIDGMNNVFRNVHELGVEAFSVARVSKAVYDLSFPMNKDHHRIFAGLIHRQNAENKLKQKVDTKGGKPDNTPPDGTPPQGGTPGSTKQKEFVNTMAIAA